MKKFFKYFRDAVKELSFVTWPKRDILVRHAGVVLAVTLVFAGGFWLIDGGMRYLIGRYIVITEPFHGTGTTMETGSGTTTPDASATSIPLDVGGLPEGVKVTPVSGSSAQPLQIK